MSVDAVRERRQEAEAARLLVEQVFALTGYDFRDFTGEFLRRRLSEIARAEGADGLTALRERVIEDPVALGRLVEALAARTASMFRDPAFFAALRKVAVPMLRTYPSVRVWHLGCGTGQETYSLAILLREEDLLKRCRIYATDLSPSAIRCAKLGAYPLSDLRGAAEAYREAGGARRLSDHYAVQGPLAALDAELRARVVFSEHSLASDSSFNEFHLVICRDVTPHFNRALQDRVFRLIEDSLCPLGLLALGRRHNFTGNDASLRFRPLEDAPFLYKKVGR